MKLAHASAISLILIELYGKILCSIHYHYSDSVEVYRGSQIPVAREQFSQLFIQWSNQLTALCKIRRVKNFTSSFITRSLVSPPRERCHAARSTWNFPSLSKFRVIMLILSSLSLWIIRQNHTPRENNPFFLAGKESSLSAAWRRISAGTKSI